jgi:UDP-glucose 4-epimerase
MIRNTVKKYDVSIYGAGGLLGRSLSLQFSKRGYSVAACVHKPQPFFDEINNIDQIQVDLSKRRLPNLSFTSSFVYYLANSNQYKSYPEGIEDVFEVNVIGLFRILRFAYEVGAKGFVYASTGSIYATKQDKDFFEPQNTPIDSSLNFYLSSKVCGESLVQGFVPLFETVVICRPFFIYGPGQRHNMLIPRLIKCVRENKPIILQGEEGMRFNPIYVEDAADAFMACSKLKGSYIFNIAGPEVVSLKTVGEIIGEIIGMDPVFEVHEKKPQNFEADIKLMYRHLCTPEIGVKEGLTKMIYEENQTGKED